METMLTLATNVVKMYVGLQVKCMLFLFDLTKPKFSLQVLISVAHYKISRKFVLR